jgi:hypothetical protein
VAGARAGDGHSHGDRSRRSAVGSDPSRSFLAVLEGVEPDRERDREPPVQAALVISGQIEHVRRDAIEVDQRADELVDQKPVVGEALIIRGAANDLR